MNNLTIAIVTVLSGATIFLLQNGSKKSIRSEVLHFEEKAQVAQENLAQGHLAFAELQKRMSNQQSELAGVRLELQNAQAEAQTATPPELDPEHEGVWPKERPYFYLAKKRLKDIGYDTITDADKLSSTAIALYSISPTERAGIEKAAQDFRTALNQLELKHAEKIEPAPGVNGENHQETTYKLPAMTNEVAPLRREFEDNINTALGAERGNLFVGHARGWLDRQDERYQISEVILTLAADKRPNGYVVHELRYQMSSGESGVMGFNYPLKPGYPIWQFRHLFGTEPLIPLAPEQTR